MRAGSAGPRTEPDPARSPRSFLHRFQRTRGDGERALKPCDPRRRGVKADETEHDSAGSDRHHAALYHLRSVRCGEARAGEFPAIRPAVAGYLTPAAVILRESVVTAVELPSGALRWAARPPAGPDPQAADRHLRHPDRDDHVAVPGVHGAGRRDGCRTERGVHLHGGDTDPHQVEDAAAEGSAAAGDGSRGGSANRNWWSDCWSTSASRRRPKCFSRSA